MLMKNQEFFIEQKKLCSSPTPQLSKSIFFSYTEPKIHRRRFTYSYSFSYLLNRSVQSTLSSLELGLEDSLRSDPAFQSGEFLLRFFRGDFVRFCQDFR
ncbi:hypothetical protein L1987_38064 [Smallanthus sonchifolius]|uniref:Uncharacterized protein n=1 Tax=Smallanthus sonchifolius TaxID=185202 RepID=A0ACB9HI15_9ASTR|nr:hypothetical protein L1987_38064 [Smallanthus sonchifolius]